MDLPRPASARETPTWTGPSPHRTPAGLRILVPGLAQWSWRQRERGLALFGSFAAALGVGVFAWGTPTGMAVLAFAFVAHVASVVDVVRQTSFPGFGRWMPVASASGGLGLLVYAPCLTVAALVAWPSARSGPAAEGYLVNCWAYRAGEPRRGDCVWMRSSSGGDSRVGRVAAGPGEEVRWSGRQLWVGGRPIPRGASFRATAPPEEFAFTVPEGHLLVAPEGGLAGLSPSEGLVLVPRREVRGRAWAQFYPLWSRRLLP